VCRPFVRLMVYPTTPNCSTENGTISVRLIGKRGCRWTRHVWSVGGPSSWPSMRCWAPAVAARCLSKGEAGIGKSTVWALGTAAAARAGWRVLTTRGSETETGLSFAGLNRSVRSRNRRRRPGFTSGSAGCAGVGAPAEIRQRRAPGPAGKSVLPVWPLLRRLCADGPVITRARRCAVGR